jgi:hypothetical protein
MIGAGAITGGATGAAVSICGGGGGAIITGGAGITGAAGMVGAGGTACEGGAAIIGGAAGRAATDWAGRLKAGWPVCIGRVMSSDR